MQGEATAEVEATEKERESAWGAPSSGPESTRSAHLIGLGRVALKASEASETTEPATKTVADPQVK